jgi:hypothetical protein
MSILVGPVTLSATGGTISSITGYKVHTFSTPGVSTFIPSQNGTIEVLVVGGGGLPTISGTSRGGGGGGAVIYNKFVNVTSGTSYPITVGNVGVAGSIGESSSFGTTLNAYGGGSGGTPGTSSPNASGGGGTGNGTTGGVGAGSIGLGFPGGLGGPVGGGGGGGGVIEMIFIFFPS